MTQTQIMYLLMGVMVLMMVLLVFLYLQKRQKEKADRIIKRSHKKNERNYLFHIHQFFKTFPVTKAYFLKMKLRLRNVYPADEMTINIKATKMMLTALFVSAAAVVGSLVIADGDWFFIMAGITMAYILFLAMIDGNLEKTEQKLLGQFRDLIDSIREQYNKIQRVDDAIGYTLDDLPYEIGLHATRIHQILTSTRVEDEVNDYVDEAPNRFFMTFAAICGTTVEYGDKRLGVNKESMFLRNLNFLKEEVNIELLRRKKNDSLFSGLTLVTLLPIFAIKPIESWATSNMPEIGEYYKGSYGIISMALVFLLSAVAYTLVKNLKGQSVEEIKENSPIKRLSEIRSIRHVLNVQTRKNYSKSLKVDEMLRMTGDRLGINTFLLTRYILAVAIALVTGFLLTASIVREKTQAITDFATSFDSSIVPDADYRETMRATAQIYAEEMAKVGVKDQPSAAELATRIQTETGVTDDALAKTVANEVLTRVERYRNTYFKWYFLLAIFGSAWVGYMVPYWILKFKQNTVKMNMEDEVSQFQTLALILMYVDGVNTTMILEWMERFSFCFKSNISQCIIDVPFMGQKALETLQYSESFPLFQSFVGNLLSIDNVGVVKAFSGIETDREYYKEKRQADNEILMKKKSEIGKWIALAPLIFVFGMYLIYPMMKLAMTMMNQINAAL